jgi:lipoate-protein ligase A
MYTYFKILEEVDTYKNLAYEQALASMINNRAEQDEILCLVLWQSRDALVFGRNQNIAKECNLALAKEHGTQIVRRTTGGGAVYHDMGNLCFSFIATDSVYSEYDNFTIVLAALEVLGISAKLSGRNDIIIIKENVEKKISGNAFATNGRAKLHHGTILVNEDLEIAKKMLTPSKFKLKSKGIKSVRSRMTNLKDLIPDITMNQLKKEIETQFVRKYKNTFSDTEQLDASFPAEIYEQTYVSLTSPEWIKINKTNNKKCITGKWGELSYSIEEKDGRVKEIIYDSDAINVELLQSMMNGIEGIEIETDKISAYFRTLREQYAGIVSENDVNMMSALEKSILSNIA